MAQKNPFINCLRGLSLSFLGAVCIGSIEHHMGSYMRKNMDALGFEPRAFRTGFVALHQVRQTCVFFRGANPAAAIHLKRRHEICCHTKWRIAGWACIQRPSCVRPGHLQNSNRSVQVVKEVAHSLSLHVFCARYAV